MAEDQERITFGEAIDLVAASYFSRHPTWRQMTDKRVRKIFKQARRNYRKMYNRQSKRRLIAAFLLLQQWHAAQRRAKRLLVLFSKRSGSFNPAHITGAALTSLQGMVSQAATVAASPVHQLASEMRVRAFCIHLSRGSQRKDLRSVFSGLDQLEQPNPKQSWGATGFMPLAIALMHAVRPDVAVAPSFADQVNWKGLCEVVMRSAWSGSHDIPHDLLAHEENQIVLLYQCHEAWAEIRSRAARSEVEICGDVMVFSPVYGEGWVLVQGMTVGQKLPLNLLPQLELEEGLHHRPDRLVRSDTAVMASGRLAVENVMVRFVQSAEAYKAADPAPSNKRGSVKSKATATRGDKAKLEAAHTAVFPNGSHHLAPVERRKKIADYMKARGQKVPCDKTFGRHGF